jgi:hypothetical protein
MSGLDPEQLDELVWRIEEQLEEPWHKGIGRPKDLSLREAVVVASGYMRQNIIQEVWAEIFDTSQPVISGIIAKFTPLIEASTEEDRPTAEEAEEAVAREQTVLVDGFLAPTWSWRDTSELWSGKHRALFKTPYWGCISGAAQHLREFRDTPVSSRKSCGSGRYARRYAPGTGLSRTRRAGCRDSSKSRVVFSQVRARRGGVPGG